MKVKEESEKVGLKLNIQKMKIMASGPIMSWQIDGEIMETVRDFIFLGSKITADGDCSHEIKRRLLLRRNGVAFIVIKRVQNAVLGCNLKNDRIISVHFQDKPFDITVIQVYSPISSAEEAEVDWCSLGGLMLKLKLQYFGHLT